MWNPSLLAKVLFRYPGGELRTRIEFQLLENPAHVSGDRTFGDGKPRRDLAVCQPPGDEDRDLLFTAGKRGRSPARRWLLRQESSRQGRLGGSQSVLYGRFLRDRFACGPRFGERRLVKLRTASVK
jgi:hypothetical protein